MSEKYWQIIVDPKDHNLGTKSDRILCENIKAEIERHVDGVQEVRIEEDNDRLKERIDELTEALTRYVGRHGSCMCGPGTSADDLCCGCFGRMTLNPENYERC